MSFIDYYAILKVDRFATNIEIRAAYLKRCKEWHPDKNPDINTTKMMQVINDAKSILLDTIKRANYDYLYNSFITDTAHQQRATNTNKQQERNNKEDDQYHKKQKSNANKERYSKLKERVISYKIKDPYMQNGFLIEINNKNNKELIDICLEWSDYSVEFIDLIVIELYEKRNYDLDAIYSLIKEKPNHSGNNNNEVKKIDWSNWAIRWLVFCILVAISRASH